MFKQFETKPFSNFNIHPQGSKQKNSFSPGKPSFFLALQTTAFLKKTRGSHYHLERIDSYSSHVSYHMYPCLSWPRKLIATKRGSCSIFHQTGAPSTPDGLYRPCLLPARPSQRQIVEGLRMRRSLLSSFIVGAGLDYDVYILEGPEFGWPQNREVSDRTAGKTTSVWNFCAGVVLLYRTLCWSCMQGERAKDVHVLVVRMDVQFLRTKGPLSCTKDSDASDRRTKNSSASNG